MGSIEKLRIKLSQLSTKLKLKLKLKLSLAIVMLGHEVTAFLNVGGYRISR